MEKTTLEKETTVKEKKYNFTHRDPKTGKWYDDISGKWIDKEKNVHKR